MTPKQSRTPTTTSAVASLSLHPLPDVQCRGGGRDAPGGESLVLLRPSVEGRP